MNKYDKIQELSKENFRRLTGVKKETFSKMLEILEKAEAIKRAKGGRKNKASLPDRLLMCLEYLREYRTYFHIAGSYGISESACNRNSRWIEDILIKSGEFSLPSKKALLKSDVEYEVVLVDVTECPIERPKKGKKNITQGRKNAIRRKPKC